MNDEDEQKIILPDNRYRILSSSNMGGAHPTKEDQKIDSNNPHHNHIWEHTGFWHGVDLKKKQPAGGYLTTCVICGLKEMMTDEKWDTLPSVQKRKMHPYEITEEERLRWNNIFNDAKREEKNPLLKEFYDEYDRLVTISLKNLKKENEKAGKAEDEPHLLNEIKKRIRQNLLTEMESFLKSKSLKDQETLKEELKKISKDFE